MTLQLPVKKKRIIKRPAPKKALKSTIPAPDTYRGRKRVVALPGLFERLQSIKSIKS
jgi:hypothetical protein